MVEKEEVHDAIETVMAARRPSTAKGEHAAKHYVRSLPMLAVNSGLVRIHRRSYDGIDVHQVQNVAVAKYDGFAVREDGSVDWKKPVLREVFNRRNVVPIGATPARDEAYDRQSLTEWRTIFTSDELTIAMCPATSTRCQFRVSLPTSVLLTMLGDKVTSVTQLRASMPMLDFDRINVLDGAELLTGPRKLIFVEKLSESRVTIVFEAASSPKTAAKAAFEAARRR